ncbi:MAG TPA: disulfide bond formation protein B [Pseudomonadales bacterium]|nr:disulfide bond formation protein B [Pseudomonadales bacterium]
MTSIASILPIRLSNFIIAAGCAVLIGIALYMQYSMGLEPCPLCMTQRVAIIAVGVVAFIAFLHHPSGALRRAYAGVGALLAVLGGAVSSRQLWLQSLPEDQVPACGPSLDYMLETFPLADTLRVMLQGDGNCAEVVWTFLGLSIPGWTLVAFIGLCSANLWLMLRRQ